MNVQRRNQFGSSQIYKARWSPRSMSGEAVEEAHLNRLFEAAHWAPSAYNNQPWRFVYVMRNTPQWHLLFDCLVAFNQGWCAKAGALILVLSRNLFEHNGKPNPTHAFDAGAAWMQLALEASQIDLVCHCMSGFDYDKVRRDLSLHEEWTPQAIVAVGKPAPAEQLPPEIVKGDLAMSGRKAVGEIAVPLSTWMGVTEGTSTVSTISWGKL